MNLNELQRIIGMWQDATFGKQDGSGAAAHLKHEFAEWCEAEACIAKHQGHYILGPGQRAWLNANDAIGESVDMLMLILCWLRSLGVHDVEAKMLSKLEINMNRTWGPPNADGSVEHIKEAHAAIARVEEAK